MKILRNYLLKDFISSFFFSILAVTMALMLGNLILLMDMVFKGFHIIDAFKIFGLHLLSLLAVIIPPSLLMATLLSVGRLVADNELVAINVAGISLTKIMSLFLIIAVILGLTLFILNDKIVPDFHYNYRVNKHVSPKDISAIIEPGIVYSENLKNITLYIRDKKGNILKNIYISEESDTGANRLVYAKSGEFIVDNGTLKLKLEQGFRDEVNADNELYRLKFKLLFYNIPLKEAMEDQPKKIDKKASDMSMDELKQQINRLTKRGIPSLNFSTEFYKRINLAVSPIIFVILGFGISLVVKHREKSINFLAAFLTTAIYYIFLVLGEALSESGLVDPILSMSIPNILIFVVGGFLFIKNAYIR